VQGIVFLFLSRLCQILINEEINLEKTQKALGVVPDVILEEFLNLIKKK